MNKLKQLISFFNDETPYYAASLSFFTIFSILPLIALLIVVISNAPMFVQHLDKIIVYILDFINPTHSGELASALEKFLINTNKLGSIGIFYLLFVFTMFFKDYEHIVSNIYDTKPRALYKLVFVYLSFMVLIPLLFALFVFLSTFAYFSFAISLFASFFVWLLFAILFILSANKKISFGSAIVSGLVTLIALGITKNLFIYYVAISTTYVTIYGSFSVALFFFLWIYISWNIFLYGIKFCSILNKG